MEARSSAGNVDIKCEGFTLPSVKAESSAGTVRVLAAEVSGMYLNSAAGTVHAYIGALNGDATLSSSAGSVHGEFKSLNGNINAKASMGSVKLRLPDPANCRIEASSRMGGVHNRVKQNEQSPFTVRAESNMGSVTIEAV
jgi:uncharacterized protein involved in outer membrane biogenesis